MKLLPAPGKVLDLSKSEYRPEHPSIWRVVLACIRHPIIAFTVWAKSGEPVSARGQILIIAALVHGLVAWALVSR